MRLHWISIYAHTYVHIYIYMYIEGDRERERDVCVCICIHARTIWSFVNYIAFEHGHMNSEVSH